MTDQVSHPYKATGAVICRYWNRHYLHYFWNLFAGTVRTPINKIGRLCP